MHSRVPRMEQGGSVYLHDWADDVYGNIVGREAVLDDFELDPTALEDVEILLASYDYHDYEGHAFVLFRQEGKLYEVNGNHCSCYKLEGQWEPEETTVRALRYRVEKGGFGKVYYHEFAEELLSVLTRLEAQ